MDPFKRATLLTSQAALGQITSHEVQEEMKTLIPQMQADPESQINVVTPLPAEPPLAYPPQGY